MPALLAACLNPREMPLALAAAQMVEQLGGTVDQFGFLIELTFLPGRQTLSGYDVVSLVQY